MSDAALAICGVFGGCQVNVFLLELITVGSPNTLYALTFAQYVVVALLALPLVCCWKTHSSSPPSVSSLIAWFPLQLRPSRLLLSHRVILAISAWLMSLCSNLVLGLYVSVPLHATFRSSSLLLNMVAGYFFLGKRYTAAQVFCATTICGGLVALAVEKSRKQSAGVAATSSSFSSSSPTAVLSAEQYFWWACGIGILTVSTALSTGLGIFQEFIYSDARRREAESAGEKKTLQKLKRKNSEEEVAASRRAKEEAVPPAPMWAEALFFSHALGTPLFLLLPWRLHNEFSALSPDNYVHFALNALTQYLCVAGVYVLNDKTSAFTLILTLTLRKLASFALSVVYFAHYRHFSVVEWIAMTAALFAGALYPLVPKPKTHSKADATNTTMGEKMEAVGKKQQ